MKLEIEINDGVAYPFLHAIRDLTFLALDQPLFDELDAGYDRAGEHVYDRASLLQPTTQPER